MIAEEAGKLIHKFIDKSWPEDREDVYEVLRLALNKAWQEGKWYGMTAEFSVPVETDEMGTRYIIAPKSHPVLLAVNVDGKPEIIRDTYFHYHQNGDGRILDREGCRWQTHVVDYGATPYINNINFNGGVAIGVRALGPVGENEKVYIDGLFENGAPVVTFRNIVNAGVSCRIVKESKEVEVVRGVEIKINDGFHYINNVRFDKINSIHKTSTISPIEVIAIDCNNNAKVIAILDPSERESKYRKYLVPAKCNPCVRGLFKIAKQAHISSGTDKLIIDSEEAIISLSKGIHLMYYKDNPEMGALNIINGISILEKERREEESPTMFPLQVDPMNYLDLAEILRR